MVWYFRYGFAIICIIMFFLGQKKGTIAKNLEIDSFTDSTAGSSCTFDTDNESEYSACSSKRSRLMSNCESNKCLVKNLETESFTDSKTGSSISDTNNESQHSASTSKKSKVKSNRESNKLLASFKALDHLKNLVRMFSLVSLHIFNFFSLFLILCTFRILRRI